MESNQSSLSEGRKNSSFLAAMVAVEVNDSEVFLFVALVVRLCCVSSLESCY